MQTTGAIGAAEIAAQIVQLVEDFRESNAGVRHAVVLATDGLPLFKASGMTSEQMQRLAASASGMFSLSKGIGGVLELGALENTLVRLAGGNVIISAIPPHAVLAVTTDVAVDLRQVGYKIGVIASQLGPSLSQEVIGELRRRI
jgi:predicted regulator of Ras-like GTPase activity (Roadblock/LC7/MglB family)